MQFHFAYRRSPDQDRAEAAHHRVVIVGAGPVGLTLALDLQQRGIATVLLDDADRIGEGSRAICFAKRTLEIWDRLGVAGPMVEKGVVWSRGRVFLADREVYDFDLLPEGGHKMPAFINLQQYYVEKHLVDAVVARGGIDLRWRNRVTAVTPRRDGVLIAIETPDGPYTLTADWLIACDGARSPTRQMLGLEFKGEVFEDQFLIADVKMKADFPTERWFWFDPPFHPGQSALLHRQPDDIWRIDLQLSPDADTTAERRPESVRPRIERMLGHGDFDLEWVSIYKFQCRRLERFVHGRVIFAGDSAHQVSPFGARGANSGVQDADNLGWKLALAIEGAAPVSLIDTYDLERGQAADENIGHSTRSTDFIAPRSAVERHFRNAALELSAAADFAKRFVNSGRLSTATCYDSPLSTPAVASRGRLGAPLPDAPVVDREGRPAWLLETVARSPGIVALACSEAGPALRSTDFETINLAQIPGAGIDLTDRYGIAAARLGLKPGTVVVIRPDQHIAAILEGPRVADVEAAVARAAGAQISGAGNTRLDVAGATHEEARR